MLRPPTGKPAVYTSQRCFRSRSFSWVTAALSGIGAALALTIVPPTVRSAERLQFFAGPFQATIWVEDLAIFAEEGVVTDRFHYVARFLNDSQRQELRTFLNQSLDVNLINLSQFTYWQVGERFLDRLGQVVQTDGFEAGEFLNGSRALRAALLLSAEDGVVTPLELMRVFPSRTIQLDYRLTRRIIQENRRFFADRDRVMAALRAMGDREAANFPIPARLSSPTQTGPFAWSVETFTFQHPLRKGNIPFDIYLPQGPTAPIPVVVISHGAASSRQAFGYLAQHLASHGYAVVVPQHDDDSQKYEQFLAGVDRPPNPITLVSRPQDISLALDELEKKAIAGGPYAQLDLQNVGVIGHSLGGFTVLTAAGAKFNFPLLEENCSLEQRDQPSLNPSLLVQCDLLDLADQAPFQLRDPRIQAVMALNPPASLFFGQAGLAPVQIPTLLMASTADLVVPAIPEQIDIYDGLQADLRYLVVAENATHFSFLAGNATQGAIPLPKAFLGPDPKLAQPYLKAIGLAFFDRHLRDRVESEGFLTQTYLDSLGTDPFRIAIVRQMQAIETQ